VSAEVSREKRLRRGQGRSAGAGSSRQRARRQAANPAGIAGGPFRIEAGSRGNERVFTIVALSGNRLYSFADWESALLEVAILNAPAYLAKQLGG